MSKFHLYLASYDNARMAKEGSRIHWALLVAPKHEDAQSFEKTTALYHATNKNGCWDFEVRRIECVRSPAMFGRVLVGAIDKKHLDDADCALRDPRYVRPRDPRWNCRTWVEEALCALLKGRLVVPKHAVDLDDLFAFAERFADEVAQRGLNVGYDVPVTVEYPGLGR